MEARQALWDHLMGSVVRLCLPVWSDKTRARWPLHPLWESMMAIRWPDSSRPIRRVMRPTLAPRDPYLGRQFQSLITSVMAREGYEEAQEAVAKLWEILDVRLREEQRITGKVPEETLLLDSRVKARAYCTQLNPSLAAQVTRYESDAARAYRRASDGL